MEKIRSFDSFGAPVSLKYKGDAAYRTLGGGIATVCLKVLILGYFMMQTLAVLNYEDPKIGSYEVFESRRTSNMEPMNLGEYALSFFIGFQND